VEVSDGDWVMVALAFCVSDGICGVIDAAVVQAASSQAKLDIKIVNIFIFLTSHRLLFLSLNCADNLDIYAGDVIGSMGVKERV
jgi:hypothetical protein